MDVRNKRGRTCRAASLFWCIFAAARWIARPALPIIGGDIHRDDGGRRVRHELRLREPRPHRHGLLQGGRRVGHRHGDRTRRRRRVA